MKIISIPPIMFFAYYSGVVVQISYGNLFLFHGMVEILLISASIIYLHNLKTRIAILSGLVGWGIMSFNMSRMLYVPPSEYIDQISLFFNKLAVIFWLIIGIIVLTITFSKIIESIKKYNHIKKQILDLGTQFTRLEIKEISEKTKQDGELIIRIIKDMIVNKEIYAEYFNNTKTLVVNQQANLEQLEILISKINLEGEQK